MKNKMSVGMVLVSLLILSGCAVTGPSDSFRTYNENVCGEICSSHGQDFVKIVEGAYRNPVCYCDEASGEIWTYVL